MTSMRYRLRTLLIVLALGPMLLAWVAWPAYRDYVKRRRIDSLLKTLPSNVHMELDGTITITAGLVPNLDPIYEIRDEIRKLSGEVMPKQPKPRPAPDPFTR
jgi:hypothetical protein